MSKRQEADNRAVLALRLLRMHYQGWLSREEWTRFEGREAAGEDAGALLRELDAIEATPVNSPGRQGPDCVS